MNSTAKSLVLKAQDSLDTANKFIGDDQQHDIAGYNLAQATECFLKALCSERDLEFPQGEESHDLDHLLSLLEEDGLTAISSLADVVDLTPYNSPRAHIRKEDRMNLKEALVHVEDLKNLVREHLM
jgi:HEPN domain-containing protein